VETHPGQQAPSGLLANLQVTRAKKSLIECIDSHDIIFGAIIVKIKLPK
jgi:hypothetical protein